MLVSFIIIAKDSAMYLEKCLECLKLQDYNHKDIEVILVDSMSKDNTIKLFESFKENSDFKEVKILQNKKITLPCGWNVALSKAIGETVLRVDAHTIFEPSFISKNVKEIENGEDIVGGKCISIIKDNNKISKLMLEAENSMFGSGIAGFRRLETKKYVSTLAFAMYKREIFKKAGEYNENLARTEDNEMHYRMKQLGYKFCYIPEIKITRYARSKFSELVKQKYENGKWIGITLKYCKKCFSIYHFVPLLFVLSIIGCIVFSSFSIHIFSYMLLVMYGLFNIASIISVSIKNSFKIEYLLLPFIYFSLHISYGIGTIIGIIKGIFKN